MGVIDDLDSERGGEGPIESVAGGYRRHMGVWSWRPQHKTAMQSGGLPCRVARIATLLGDAGGH